MKKSKRAQIIWRYAIVSTFITGLALAIIYSAVRTTVIDADKWNHKADSMLSKVFIEQPRRGDILAADGTVLATNLTRYTICIDYKTNAKHDSLFAMTVGQLADTMARYYPQRTSDQWRDYLAKPLEKPASQRKTYHVLMKNATYADYQRILKFPFFNKYKKRYDHGLYANPVETRMMPYGSMAKRSIGRCNYQPEPRFEGAKRRADSVDMLRGYSGLEYALDSLLFGRPGTAKYVPLTRGVRSWVDQPAQDGYSIRTTIDINIQDIVECELLAMLEHTRAEWGTCLLMEVETGDIKAISNLDRDEHGHYIEAMNYALQAFEPGSVMKPISMIVALEDKFAPLDRAYPIGSSYAYAGGSPIRDTHSPAYLPVSRFIEYSSNIGMTKLIAPHYDGNLNGFRERLRQLGFFDRFNTGMAGERPPYFPTLDPKAGGRVSLSRMSYGYSTMIPPLYTCAVYNAIANKGKFVRPRLWTEKISRDGTVERQPVSYVRDSICSQKNAKILMGMLHSVVYGEGGTAKTLKNDIVTLAGKTGTCRIAYENKPDTTKDGKKLPRKIGYKENQYRLAFCGVFPYENPKYTCMVLLSNPSPDNKSAPRTSGQVVLNIALKMHAHGLLDRYSDYTAEKGSTASPVVYACDKTTLEAACLTAGSAKVKHMAMPKEPADGKVPDVIGLGLRDALARIEDAGYAIEAHGTGYAYRQSPAPGSDAMPGQTVKVSFSTR